MRERIVGHTWQMTIPSLWQPVSNRLEVSCMKNPRASTTKCRNWPAWPCRDGHPWATSKDVIRHPARTSTDISLHKIVESFTDVLDNCFAYCRILMGHWEILLYEVSINLLTDNRTDSTREFFELLCTRLGTEQQTTTAYHQQRGGQAKRFKKMIITGFWEYLS